MVFSCYKVIVKTPIYGGLKPRTDFFKQVKISLF